MREKLTKKQQELLQMINIYINKNRIAPSVRELTKLVGLKSSSTTHGYLRRLKKKGYITWDETMPRTLKVIKQDVLEDLEMVELNCKELYRIHITMDMIEEFYQLGEAYGRRHEAVNNIYGDKNISDKLKISCMVQYNKEWHESLFGILANLRNKANLENDEHVMHYDVKTKELIILDLLRSDYRRLLEEHTYLVKVNTLK
jgi:repressor LexA